MEREKRKLSWKKWRVLYLMLIPGLVYIVIFNYIPMYGVTIAFKDFYASKGIMGSPWVGLEHFKRVFRSPDFLQILWNTLSLSIYQLLITFPLPIFLALLINSCHSKRFGKFVQNVTYAPYLVSVVVLVGMMMIMFAPRVFSIISLIFWEVNADCLWGMPNISDISLCFPPYGRLPAGIQLYIWQHFPE